MLLWNAWNGKMLFLIRCLMIFMRFNCHFFIMTKIGHQPIERNFKHMDHGESLNIFSCFWLICASKSHCIENGNNVRRAILSAKKVNVRRCWALITIICNTNKHWTHISIQLTFNKNQFSSHTIRLDAVFLLAERPWESFSSFLPLLSFHYYTMNSQWI